jgi:hypothetical protein
MQPDQGHPHTHLFTVRLWVEPLGDDQREVRMQVKHLLSGETHYFRTWAEVVTFLLAKIQALEIDNPGKGGPSAK